MIQVRLQGGPCVCGHQGCKCVSGVRICWETGGSLWDNMALERSAVAPAHCNVRMHDDPQSTVSRPASD